MTLEIPETFFAQLTIEDYWRDEVSQRVIAQTPEGKTVEVYLPIGFLREALADRQQATQQKEEIQ